jgi:hypothetical protein
MSQPIKSESSSTLKPIEDVLESIKNSFNESIGKSSTNITTTTTASSNRISIPTYTESVTSSSAFKIIIILIVVLAGIIGYTYLEKEVNQLIVNIKNYFETKKYTNKEQEKQKEIEKENTSSQQTTKNIIKDVQSDIKKNNKNEEPVNYHSSSKLNVSPVGEEVEEYQKDALQKALDDAIQSGGEVIPDASENHIQSGKKGWCFVGSNNLSRTCTEIGVNDVCMSGEIYPTKDVCINPNLRA